MMFLVGEESVNVCSSNKTNGVLISIMMEEKKCSLGTVSQRES